MLYGALSLPPGKVHRLADELMTVARASARARCSINDLAKRQDASAGSREHAQQLLAVPLQRQEQVLGCLFAHRQARRRVRLGRQQAAELDRQRVGDLSRKRDAVRRRARPDDGPAAQPHQRGRRQGRVHLRSLRARRAAQPARSRSRAELTDAHVERIYMAGLLHDVGKIGVPEAVLQKTGKLTRRRVRADQEAPGDRRAHPARHQAGRGHHPRRAASPRALRRQGLSRAAWPARTSR